MTELKYYKDAYVEEYRQLKGRWQMEEERTRVWKRTAIVLAITCLIQGIIHIGSHHL